MSDGEAVQLYVYDLSRGLAKVFSPMLLDKTVRRRRQGRLSAQNIHMIVPFEHAQPRSPFRSRVCGILPSW